MAAIRRIIFDLGYSQLGGGGLGWSREACLSLPVSEALIARRMLKEAKEADVEASKKAAKKARRDAER